MNLKKNKNKTTAGFTLLELLIAISLGVVLSTAIMQLFITVKQVIQQQQTLMRLQDSIQTSHFIIGRAIRSAGNMGCIQWQDTPHHLMSDQLILSDIGLLDNQVIQRISIEQVKKNKLVSPSVVKNIKKNTDVLWVISSVPASPDNMDKNKNHFIVSADCQSIQLFRFSGSASQLARSYGRFLSPDKTLRKLTSTLYYIGKNHALYSVDLNDNALAHVEGIEDWKITVSAKAVNIQFVFNSSLYSGLEGNITPTRLTWDQTWAVRA